MDDRGSEALLTLDECARLLRVSPGTLRNWSYRRRIPVQKVGARRLFSPHAVGEWLRGQARPARPEPSGSHAACPVCGSAARAKVLPFRKRDGSEEEP